MSDEDFKYLVQEFGSKNLDLLKQKGVYPKEYMKGFKDKAHWIKRLLKKDSLLEEIFIALQKIEKLVMMVKYEMVI